MELAGGDFCIAKCENMAEGLATDFSVSWAGALGWVGLWLEQGASGSSGVGRMGSKGPREAPPSSPELNKLPLFGGSADNGS